ncbi:cell division ATP-binding protein FtsE [Dissulfurirhabdus thermomarina]|uniref:Cell division ATP-binding protein FtsE n=1 Tax=Dissulfurirhabdus thermomarina TaxID=1765737 RepID=A0A6N9TTE5_DISTH|nr:cell division ATP-binding protein FtsE [Dissulfurirhabdus thermomarina]NMX24023.1 cell division ATP-binding protein FtsE [Dissulfurirhabdus thermomarina]
MVRLEGVAKHYPPDIVALQDLNLAIAKGEFVFLTGPSGAGKSTLLKLLFCAERPTQGEIFVDGIPLASLSASQVPHLRRKIGVVFQDFKLLTNRRVFDNVALSLEVTGLKRDQVERRVRQILDSVGLGGRIGQLPHQLSGGEQQRVAIARAVVNRPPILLADEPTGNLDRARTDEVMALMEELNAQGTTILFATHNERLYRHTHRRVLRLVDGRVEE